MALIGYMRTSTKGQSEDSQEDELRAAGCERIFTDHGVSGKLARRPQWDACLAYMREGDVLVITRLSRAMRSIRQLLEVAAVLAERGIGLKVLKQPVDTTTKEGRLVFHILAAIDEFQRELIVESTREGLEAARARGRKGGRKEKLSPLQARRMLEMLDERGEDGRHAYTPLQVAKTYGVSRATLYRYRDLQLTASQAHGNGENGEKQQRDKGAGEHAEA